MKRRIQFAGPSGVGKTTLAKYLEGVGDYPFISGSVSDLLPSTKNEPHKDMLAHNKEELYKQDFQILTLRRKLFARAEVYVSDRSFLDSAAYFLYKQSDTIPQCELENFLDLCKTCLCQTCDQLIVLNFTTYLVKHWVMEDNNKRILNKYFQAQISAIMLMILDNWGVKLNPSIGSLNMGIFKSPLYLNHGGYRTGILETIYGKVDILVIDEPELIVREKIISKYLNIDIVWPPKEK